MEKRRWDFARSTPQPLPRQRTIAIGLPRNNNAEDFMNEMAPTFKWILKERQLLNYPPVRQHLSRSIERSHGQYQSGNRKCDYRSAFEQQRIRRSDAQQTEAQEVDLPCHRIKVCQYAKP
jgi:hypothetical protein